MEALGTLLECLGSVLAPSWEPCWSLGGPGSEHVDFSMVCKSGSTVWMVSFFSAGFGGVAGGDVVQERSSSGVIIFLRVKIYKLSLFIARSSIFVHPA